MKIAVFHELHQGGARRAANEFAVCLKKKHTVDLYIVDEEKNNKESGFYNSINFYRFIPATWQGKNWKVRLYKDTLELFKLNQLHKKIASAINQKSYDVVLVFPSRYTQAPFILKFLQPKKVYFAMEPLRLVYDPAIRMPENLGLSRYIYEKINRLIRKIIDKVNIDWADTIIGNSKYSADFSKRVYKKNVGVAYLGLHANFFTDVHKKRDIDILFVGSLDPSDGHAFFKEVLNKYKEDIKVREVLFENEWLTDIKIRDLYRRTKILIATSYNEPLGMIPLEAMGCGVVILAVDEAGYRETIINQQNGFLIKRNAKSFAEKINFLLHNKNNLKKMSLNASQNVREFWDWEKRTKELEKFLW